MRNPTIPPGVFTEVEEEFFRAGARLDREAIDEWDELEGRRTRAATERGADDSDEDDWEWEIAIARARVAGAG